MTQTAFWKDRLASLAPLVIVVAYFGLVASFPIVRLRDLGSLILEYLVTGSMLTITFGGFLIVVALGMRMARKDVAESPTKAILGMIRKRWREDNGLSIIVPISIFALLLPSFNAFKQIVLPLAGFGLDGAIAAWDEALFFGTAPWQLAHDLLPSAESGRTVSLFYHEYFLPMAALPLCAVLPMRRTTRTQFLLSHALVWIVIGSLLAYLLPSAGPVYWAQFHGNPDPFAPLMNALNQQQALLLEQGRGSGISALFYQEMLGVGFGSPHIAMGRGISAMPSVHIALAVQFTCAAFLVRRWFGFLLGGYTVFIWFGSVYLGWHYALDGIVAAAVTVPLWLVSGRIARWLHREPQEEAQALAPAGA